MRLHEGLIFGKLTLVKKDSERNKSGHYNWIAVCECGNTVNKPAHFFHSSKTVRETRSCGCSSQPNKIGVGNIIGEFTLMEEEPPRNSNPNDTYWKIRCSCGNRKRVTRQMLNYYIRNGIETCGCKDKKPLSKNSTANKTRVGKPRGTIDNFMTLPESAVRWKVSGNSIKDRIKQEDKSGKIEKLILGGLIKKPFNKGGAWIISKALMQSWYGQEPGKEKTNPSIPGRDITGQRFGKLLVISYSDKEDKWLCQCDCGEKKLILKRSLSSGNSKSCGCTRDKFQVNNLIGQKFGRLTVVKRAPNNKGKVVWDCLCECGGSKTVRGDFLTIGKTKSCGCLKYQKRSAGKVV